MHNQQQYVQQSWVAWKVYTWKSDQQFIEYYFFIDCLPTCIVAYIPTK